MDSIKADILAVMVLEGRRYVVQELRITQRDGGEPITSELIRGVPVHSLIRGTVYNALELRPPARSSHRGPAVRLPPEERRRLIKAGPTDETQLWVARVYITAELAGDPPAQHVQRSFKVPTSTTGYWIRRAKDRKILNG